METSCNAAYNSFLSAYSHEDGRWLIFQNEQTFFGNYIQDVLLVWSTDPNHNIEFNSSNNWVLAPYENSVQLSLGSNGQTVCYPNTTPGSYSVGGDTSPRIKKIYSSTYPVTYPSGYEGLAIPTEGDLDGDGLNGAAESSQGTSNFNSDTDGDGLKDNIESVSYSARDATFCDTSSGPPYTCAYPDPLVKDLYVEVDWMDDGTDSYKPNSTQLSMVEAALDDQGYNVHIDSGQYGGGNELSDYVQFVPFSHDASGAGFFDFKEGDVAKSVAQNFNPNRQGIWRYLISGYGYDEDHSSSGASYAGSDNVFVSYGQIDDNQSAYGYTDFDTAIAGTVVHELGHSLCLSDTQKYSYQSNECVFAGVDSATSIDYNSVMNYNLQMFQTNLSNGTNILGDHDDWGAIDDDGIADFSKWDPSELAFSPGLSISQAQKAKKAGTLGKVKIHGKVHDLRILKKN